MPDFYDSSDFERMQHEIDLVKALLEYCSMHPGADITIKISHDHGHKASAHVYDEAAFSQSLYDALDELRKTYS